MFSAAVAVGVLSVSSSAFAYSSSGIGFANACKLKDNGGSGADTWEIEYGFNKAWINEDFTHTYHNSKYHTAKVDNANGPHTDSDTAGSWAGIEVKHAGTVVYYYLSLTP